MASCRIAAVISLVVVLPAEPVIPTTVQRPLAAHRGAPGPAAPAWCRRPSDRRPLPGRSPARPRAITTAFAACGSPRPRNGARRGWVPPGRRRGRPRRACACRSSSDSTAVSGSPRRMTPIVSCAATARLSRATGRIRRSAARAGLARPPPGRRTGGCARRRIWYVSCPLPAITTASPLPASASARRIASRRSGSTR